MAGPADAAAAAAVVVGVAAAAADLCATNVKDTDTWLATAPLPTDGIKLVSSEIMPSGSSYSTIVVSFLFSGCRPFRLSCVTHLGKRALTHQTPPKSQTPMDEILIKINIIFFGTDVTTRGISPEIARIRRSSVTNVEKWATWRVTVPKNSTIENDLAFRRIERWTL